MSVYPNDLVNEFHAVRGNVVDASDEGADVIGARLGGDERLRGREAKRAVCPDALFRTGLQCLDAVGDERYFHHHILVNWRQLPCLLHDPGVLDGGNFRRDISIHQLANPVYMLVKIDVARFFHERRIRGYAVQYTHGCGLADFLQIRGVYEEFHGKATG